MDTEIQGYRDTGIQGYRVTEIQGYRNTKTSRAGNLDNFFLIEFNPILQKSKYLLQNLVIKQKINKKIEQIQKKYIQICKTFAKFLKPECVFKKN